ncbi:MAG: signal peptidase I [Legionellales bacterium RIFCSPHIGHO2_12_FULL_35_11]|nr:MAG: signal peptidase I [Legionellales bacterium RIFCSPHIGHO2_12_FULL_35_11]
MNFAFWLLILSAITGLVYLLDIIYFAKKRAPNAKPNFIIEQSRSFFPIFLIVLLLRSFLIEPFRIPSGSLEPTLLVGDFVAVNKFIYGIRLPVIEKKVLPISNPKTGDIVVFRWAPDPNFDYIKRIIGTPGDVISYKNKILSINGVTANQTFIKYTTDPSSDIPVAEYSEDLAGIKHKIFKRSDFPAIDFDITVPPDSYFVMGDNRDDSADSRFWGFVQDEYIRGKAFLTWLSFNKQDYTIRWDRIGKMINRDSHDKS